MKQYYCSCCNKKFELNSVFHVVRDGKRLLYFHEKCVPVFSGGVELEKVEEKCGVVIESDVEINNLGDVFYTKPWIDEYHREDGPAVEWADGGKFWYINGKCHKEHGPSSMYADGSNFWLINGEYHREDGPAAEYPDKDLFWFVAGGFCRLGGPVSEGAEEQRRWFLNHKEYTEKGHAAEMKKRRGET